MPGDPFQFLSPNTPIDSGVGPFNLAWHNEVTKTLHSTRGQRDADNTAKNGAALQSGVAEIWIRNDSGDDLDQYSIVGIGERVVAPRKTDTSHFGRAVFESVEPTAGQPFAIMQWPTADTVLCPAISSGPTVCRIQMDRTSHHYADAETGEYAALLSQPGVGPARILWADTDAATQLNGGIDSSVTTITVDSTADFPDAPFVVQIGTEELNVTATASATTFTVTRGYNSTTAASHSDNDAVAFHAGEVWATVLLGGGSSSHEYHLGVTLDEIEGAIAGSPGGGLAMYVKYAPDSTGTPVHTLTGTSTRVFNDCTTPIAAGRLVDIFREPISGWENARDRCAFTTPEPPPDCPLGSPPATVCVDFGDVTVTLTRNADVFSCYWFAAATSLPISICLTAKTPWVLDLSWREDVSGEGWYLRAGPGILGAHNENALYYAASWDGSATLSMAKVATHTYGDCVADWPATIDVDDGDCAEDYGGSGGCSDAPTIASGYTVGIDTGSAGDIWLKFASTTTSYHKFDYSQLSGTTATVKVYPQCVSGAGAGGEVVNSSGTFCQSITSGQLADGYAYVRIIVLSGGGEFLLTVSGSAVCP